MDLFAEQHDRTRRQHAPLAARMRPTCLEDFVGQAHFIGDGKLLRRILSSDRLSSSIFYGPAGTGKTTLARIISQMTRAVFEEVNAADIGVKDLRRILESAAARLDTTSTKTILFIDEIHRFTKAQQDVLLNDVEQGVVVMIGATTENPFFTVNAPLVSRSQIFQFEPLTEEHIAQLMARALTDQEHGLAGYHAQVDSDALAFLARFADGDARRALNALEIAVLSQHESGASEIVIDLAVAQDSIQRKALRYDRGGDAHYDFASALIKSMRCGDVQSAVYWACHMMEAGEDPRFIARRLAIFASEDIGQADPQALVLASACFQVTLQLGYPECRFSLIQAVIHLSTAPKSRSCAEALGLATRDIRQQGTVPVPREFRDAHYAGASRLGHGQAAADAPLGDQSLVQQSYLGVDKEYYRPANRGHEGQFYSSSVDHDSSGAQPESETT